MTEGNEDHATQQLNQSIGADEKPVEDGTGADQVKEESIQQLASGNNFFIGRPRVFWILIEYVFDSLVNRTKEVI